MKKRKSRSRNKGNKKRKIAEKEISRVTVDDNPHGRPDGATSTESYIYVLIYTHGVVLHSDKYEEYINSCYDETTKRPAFVNADALHMADVDYVGLVTHPPLGCYDWSTPLHSGLGLAHYLFGISDILTGLRGVELRDKLRDIDEESIFPTGSAFRQSDVENKTVLPVHSSDTEKDKRKKVLSRALIQKNTDSIYAVGEYDIHTSLNGKNNILNKRYTTGSSFFENFFVISESGGNLTKGEYILKSEKFKDYKNELLKTMDPSHPTFLIDYDYIHANVDTPAINTISLIYYLRECGYRNIHLIDYSCNRCHHVDAQQIRDVRNNRLFGGKTKKKRNKKKK